MNKSLRYIRELITSWPMFAFCLVSFACSPVQGEEKGEAEFSDAEMYYDNGVPKDLEKAFEWFAKSAEQGDAKAQFMLGIMYYGGVGIPQNYEKAFEWYSKAADQGDIPFRRLWWVRCTPRAKAFRKTTRKPLSGDQERQSKAMRIRSTCWVRCTLWEEALRRTSKKHLN